MEEFKIGNFIDIFKSISKKQNSISDILDSGLVKLKDGGVVDSANKKAIVNILYNTDCVTVGVTTFNTHGYQLPSHQHKTQVQYLIVISGILGVRFEDTGGYRVLTPKECASIPEGVIHSVKSLKDNTAIIHITVPADRDILKLDNNICISDIAEFCKK